MLSKKASLENKKIDINKTAIRTTTVDFMTSSRRGHTTFRSSSLHSRKNVNIINCQADLNGKQICQALFLSLPLSQAKSLECQSILGSSPSHRLYQQSA